MHRNHAETVLEGRCPLCEGGRTFEDDMERGEGFYTGYYSCDGCQETFEITLEPTGIMKGN